MRIQKHSSGARVAGLAAFKLVASLFGRVIGEMIVARDRHCGAVISSFEYANAALLSSHVLLGRRRLPYAVHLRLLVCGIGASALSNWAVASGLGAPPRLVLKTGALPMSALVGAAYLGERYSRTQLAAVGLITVGVLLAVSSSGVRPGTASAAAAAGLVQHVVGIACVVGALLLRALRSAVQERAFVKHGVHASEVIFAQHVIGLPLFAAASDPRAFFEHWRQRELVTLAEGWALPVMWLLVAGEVATDHLTKLSSTWLVGASDALTSTLVSVLQRVVMIAVSAAVFHHDALPPTFWAGVALVAAGLVMHARA